jgi:hypothetical protein
MLEFPNISNQTPTFDLPKMSLEEYAAFCGQCLRMNPNITPETCMEQGAKNRVNKLFVLRNTASDPNAIDSCCSASTAGE